MITVRLKVYEEKKELINQSINFYLLKMSRDTHRRLFNCEQDNKAETSTNSCPTNKIGLYYYNYYNHLTASFPGQPG